MKWDWDSYFLAAIVTILLFFMCIVWLSKVAYSEERLIRPYPFIMESDGNPNRRYPTVIFPNGSLLDGTTYVTILSTAFGGSVSGTVPGDSLGSHIATRTLTVPSPFGIRTSTIVPDEIWFYDTTVANSSMSIRFVAEPTGAQQGWTKHLRFGNYQDDPIFSIGQFGIRVKEEPGFVEQVNGGQNIFSLAQSTMHVTIHGLAVIGGTAAQDKGALHVTAENLKSQPILTISSSSVAKFEVTRDSTAVYNDFYVSSPAYFNSVNRPVIASTPVATIYDVQTATTGLSSGNSEANIVTLKKLIVKGNCYILDLFKTP